jgi:acetyl esterase/lipase
MAIFMYQSLAMRRSVFLFPFLYLNAMLYAQETIPLYDQNIPNSRPVKNEETSEITKDHILLIWKVTRPTLSIFLPPKEKANGTAVVICPGGGYQDIAAGHEGYDVAKKFNEAGIAAFVLKYRIPSDQSMEDKSIGPLQDAERAIQLVRERAREWGIDTQRVGIMGFSAGGHLASTEGTHFNKEWIDNKEKTNLRPDFMILVYPVISFLDSICHLGSRDQLIGKNPSSQEIALYSNELQVNEQTAPAFLVHAKDDEAVPVRNSLVFFEALQKNNVPAEIYLYEKGGHGFGMNNPSSEVKWMDLVLEWITKNEWKKR